MTMSIELSRCCKTPAMNTVTESTSHCRVRETTYGNTNLSKCVSVCACLLHIYVLIQIYNRNSFRLSRTMHHSPAVIRAKLE